MTYEIIKNKPMPVEGAAKAKYPYLTMEVGDAFCAGPSSRTLRNRIASSASAMKRRHGLTFAQRTVDGALWVWRVA